MPDRTLDTKGLACPLPILKTKKALSELAQGGDAGGAGDRPRLGARLHGLLRDHRQYAGRAERAVAASTDFVIQHV